MGKIERFERFLPSKLPKLQNAAMNLPNFWYGSCSYVPLSENHTLYAGKNLIWRNLDHYVVFFEEIILYMPGKFRFGETLAI